MNAAVNIISDLPPNVNYTDEFTTFCAAPLWDWEATWGGEDVGPDFTPCFHKTVLVFVPCGLLWVLAPLEHCLSVRRAGEAAPIGRTWQNQSRMAFSVLLMIVNSIEFFNVLYLSYATLAPIVGADFVSPIVKFITVGLSVILAKGARNAGRVSSAVQFTFWTVLTICWGFTFGTGVTEDGTWKYTLNWNILETVVLVLQFFLALAILVLNCFADKSPRYLDIKVDVEKRYEKLQSSFDEQIINPSPEKRSSWFNRLLFLWFDSTVWKARKQTVNEDMLWDLNKEDSVYFIYPRWEKLWTSYVRRQRRKQQLKKIGGGSSSKPPLILSPLLRQFGAALAVSAAYELVYVLLQFASPQLLNLLIAFVQGEGPEWHGYVYTVLFSVVALAVAVSDSGYWYRVNLVGLRVRSALSSSVYRKSLRLSNTARKKYTAGEIVNLISVDCQKLQDACLFLNMMWASPLQVGLSIYFLYNEIGPSVFAGLGALLILFPLNSVIWAYMEKNQVKQMVKKDERVRMITEILGGIKVLKLYAWEPSFIKRIGDIRETEISFLKRLQYLEATQFFVWNSAPFLVALASFATYVLSDPVNNVLDSQTAFVSLTLFNTMRGPLFLLPFGIVSLIQGMVSIRRISEYLNQPELDQDAISHGESTPFPVSLSHCSFTWGDSPSSVAGSAAGISLSSTTLKDITWRVEDKKLVAVVGTVGSGKSSLLSALLGEMTKVEGDINVRGSIAYVPQQAWMQNATLKNNILFGKAYKRDLYEKVIDACALRPDLSILTGGDETEIGEKGINVSGGQKQRISLARAVYNNADLYLLDDPLSAVDSHVGKHIFEKVIGPKGALRTKTRILVTHAISFLPDMDEIIVMKNGKISEVGTYEDLLRSRGAFAEFLLEQLKDKKEDGTSGSESDGGLPEIDRERLRRQLSESLGEEETAKALQLHQRQKSRRKRAGRVKTTSIGSLSDHNAEYLSETDSVFSLGVALNRSSKAGGAFLQRGESLVEESSNDKASGKTFQSGRDLIQEETAATHRVKFSIYVYYAKALGCAVSIGAIAFYALFQGFTVGANLWLAVWSGDEDAAQIPVRDKYLTVYGVLGLLQSCCILVAVVLVTVGTLRASIRLHTQMLERVLGSTMAFFDTTPVGRIVNRFSKDIDEVDIMIPTHLKDILNSLFSVIGTLFVICFASPVIIGFVIPLIGAFIFIQTSYLAASRQLKRMVSVTRSPVNSSLTESFGGAATIRAFDAQRRFVDENDDKIEFNQKWYYPECASGSWLFCRLEGLANVLIILSSLFAVINRDTVDPGLVGLSLTYALTFQLDIFLLTRFTADLEKSIVSVERIREYQHTPLEAPASVPHQDPDPNSWPSDGVIEFRDYTTRYREGMDLVLRGVSCKIKSGEKVGIVGRTGAGKSSLTLSLFRLIEAAGGSIVIDGVDISHIGLATLREALTIIPQDPVLFTGTLRSNLDPFASRGDAELWSALRHAHLHDYASGLDDGLDHRIAEGGENLSVGQRQLVCLARALLRKTKILILDEATAAVDLETDDLIQATIRKEFQDCTVLTIAHRLKTIMDSDKILLLDAGKVLEFDSPKRLLANPNSSFYSMAKDAGLVR